MDKLHNVLKIKRQQEDESAAQLARSQADVAAAQAKQHELLDLMEEYRRRHLDAPGAHPARLAEFNRFYTQLKGAVEAQGQIVANLERVEAQNTDTYLVRYRERLVLQRLLEERELAHKTAVLRKERRAHIHRDANFFV